jgi:hypothetical protein
MSRRATASTISVWPGFTEDFDVPGDTAAKVGEATQRSYRDRVRETEHAVELHPGFCEATDGAGARVHGEIGRYDELFVPRHPRFLERLAVSLGPQSGHRGIRGIHTAGAAEGHDPLAAALQEVLRRGTSAVDVRHDHVVDLAVGDPLTDDHDREAEAQQANVCLPKPHGTEHETVVHPQPREVDGVEFALAARTGLLDDHTHALALEALDEQRGELTEVRAVNLRDSQSDDARPTGAEALAGQVHSIAQAVDRVQDASARLISNVRTSVDDVRHRHRRHTRRVRDVVHGHHRLFTSIQKSNYARILADAPEVTVSRPTRRASL